MNPSFDKIKTLLSLQNEFIVQEEKFLVLERMRLSHLKHKIINFMCTLYEIEIDEDYYMRMRENDMKYFYHEFHKRVFNNLILRVYHIFAEDRKPGFFLYLIFERSEFMIFQCFSFKNQTNYFQPRTKSLQPTDPQESQESLNPQSKLIKTKSSILGNKILNLEEEELLIQVISFYYDVMSLLAFLENKKYHFSFYFHIINPNFLFISRVEPEQKFVFHIQHKYIIKFLMLPEPLLQFLYINSSLIQGPIRFFFQNLHDNYLNSFDLGTVFPTLKKISPFYNIFMSSRIFLDILKNINNTNLSKQAYNLKTDLIKLLNRSIDHFVLEILRTKEADRFPQKHFLNRYYKELKSFLQVYVFSEKIKQIFSKIKSKVYQHVIMKDVTHNHILQKILENTNPLVKSLHFSDTRINSEFFKDFTVAFEYLEELIINNHDRTSRPHRIEEKQLKTLIYSGKMKNLRILDLAGNSIKLSGPLFMNKLESASLREKALPNIIQLNLSKNELKCEDCQMILQEPVFGNVRKINLSENSIDSVFKEEKGYCLLAKLESLNFSKNLINNVGSQSLFESYGLDSLRKLDLSYNKIVYPVKVSHLINLRKLKLDYNLIDSNGCQSIFSNEYLKNLEELSLVGNIIKVPLKSDSVNKLLNLRKLNLSKNSIADQTAQILFTKEMKLDHLAELDLSNNSLDVIIPSQEKINPNLIKNLNFLNLSFNHISDEGANTIFSTEFKNLFGLNLNFNEIWEPVGEGYLLLNLIKLELNNNRITDTGCQRLFEKLTPASKLSNLDLQKNCISNPIDINAAGLLANSIEKINLNFNCINSEGSQALFASKCFPKLATLIMACNKIVIPVKENNLEVLTHLTLANNLINSEGAAFLFRSVNFEELVSLDLYKNLIENPFDSENTNNLNQLVDLDLKSNKISCKGANQIFSSLAFENLEKLCLDNNQICVPFKESSTLINLHYLSMKHNKISSEGSQAIFQSKSLKNLRKLYLQYNQIEVPVVSVSSPLKHLYKINLVGNKVTSEGCQNLLKMTDMEKLEILSVSRNKVEYPIDKESPCNLVNLRRLNLSFNPLKFEGVAPIFCSQGLKNLETIKIMECELEELLDANKSVELTKLRYLLAAQNRITSLACQNVFMAENLKNLQILDLCNNNIEFPLKAETPIKPKLSTILLSRNVIGSEGASILFSSTKIFPKLLNLDLSDNSIQQINKEKFNLFTLAQLNLIENNLDYETNRFVDELLGKMKVLF